jgi:hypothetical protein
MKTILTKIASILAFIIGAMAVFAGGQVLLGKDPGYFVIDWLPVYNYTAGILTVFITAILIWVNSKFALAAAIGTFSVHTLVMIILQTAYRSVVAPDSIMAMTIRMVVWGIVLVLMYFQRRKSMAAKTSIDSTQFTSSKAAR